MHLLYVWYLLDKIRCGPSWPYLKLELHIRALSSAWAPVVLQLCFICAPWRWHFTGHHTHSGTLPLIKSLWRNATPPPAEGPHNQLIRRTAQEELTRRNVLVLVLTWWNQLILLTMHEEHQKNQSSKQLTVWIPSK